MLYSISYPLVILFLYLYILFFRTGLIFMRQAFFSKFLNSLFTKFLFLLLTLSLKRWRYKVHFSFLFSYLYIKHASSRVTHLRSDIPTMGCMEAANYEQVPFSTKLLSKLGFLTRHWSLLFIYASLITITHLRFDTPTMGCMEAANYE